MKKNYEIAGMWPQPQLHLKFPLGLLFIDIFVFVFWFYFIFSPLDFSFKCKILFWTNWAPSCFVLSSSPTVWCFFSNVYKLLVLSGVLMCEEVFISKELGETNNKRSLTDCFFNVRQETNTRIHSHKSVSLLNEFHFLNVFRLRKSEFNFIDCKWSGIASKYIDSLL